MKERLIHMKGISVLILLFSLLALSFSLPDKKNLRIFLVGDSTMQPYNPDKTPQRGWGQMLPLFFQEEVEIINKARGGRSTKSYIKEGLWDSVIQSVQKGDWVFIEFGHNDHDQRKPERYTTPEDYGRNLTKMVHDVIAKGAHPILLTPIAMRTFNAEGQYRDGHGAYPEKVREVAKLQDIPLIDLDKSFGALIGHLGPQDSKKLFMNFGPDLYTAFPDGKEDDTHLREPGAMKVAELVAAGIREQKIKPLEKKLSSHLT